MSYAYYNEIDSFAAAWLRELIKAGHIADGIVDERSIEDVEPNDLKDFTQCHFFAGIGVWSYALRCAGWPDDRPVWTGSCPCQPFSAAGKGKGFADERHLWPAFHWLISQCYPSIIIGEQVASKDGLEWFDLVSSDMEAAGYAVGTVDTCAAGVGAPHIRQRLYWVAVSARFGYKCQSDTERSRVQHEAFIAPESRQQPSAYGAGINRVANATSVRCLKQWGAKSLTLQGGCAKRTREQARPDQTRQLQRGFERFCGTGGLADSSSKRFQGSDQRRQSAQREADDRPIRFSSTNNSSSPTNGFWRDADWLLCRDGRWRPVESGTFPLAHGAAARVGRLRGYGNAINAKQAQAFIEAMMDII